MNRKAILSFGAGAACTAALTLLIAAGPGHDHDPMGEVEDTVTDAVDHAMGETPEDMMAGMKRLATPNEFHQALEIMVGNWSAKTSFIMDPSAPPMEGEGKMSVKWVLGGRYVHSSFTMDFMGEPFEGIGYTGYDIAHEQYVSTWMDTMSTTIFHMKGGEEAGDALVLYGISTTPAGDHPTKMVTAFTDKDTWIDTFYDQTPDGEWNKSGTITYTRD
ncbi:MAG: DUF1579 domain-containing protein [Phycisphaerales bacterium]|nr:DUF1579 domain-containing protein [Phycisphaerales bacterium]